MFIIKELIKLQDSGFPSRYDGTTFHPVANIPVPEAFYLFHRDQQGKRIAKKLLYAGGALVFGYLGYTFLSKYWKK